MSFEKSKSNSPSLYREMSNGPWETKDQREIKVLDHGHVRLVDILGNDLSVVRAARVSYNAEWRAGEEEKSDKRLINYLIRNNHTSPFEHVSFTFDVKAPIFVLRQWHRHRTWKYNEVSARYTELPGEYYLPEHHLIGVQSKDNKQGRDIKGITTSDLIYAAMSNSCRHAFITYQELLKEGVPRELARTVLPLATYSHMFATVDLHNLFHFLRLRLHEHAQYEIRVYAQAMLDLITPVVPVCVEAFKSCRESS